MVSQKKNEGVGGGVHISTYLFCIWTAFSPSCFYWIVDVLF